MSLRRREERVEYYELIVPQPYQQQQNVDASQFEMRKLHSYGEFINKRTGKPFRPEECIQTDYLRGDKPLILY